MLLQPTTGAAAAAVSKFISRTHEEGPVATAAALAPPFFQHAGYHRASRVARFTNMLASAGPVASVTQALLSAAVFCR
jgi:hypothetical protein